MQRNNRSMLRNNGSMLRNERSMFRNSCSMQRNERSMHRNICSTHRNSHSMLRNNCTMHRNSHLMLGNTHSGLSAIKQAKMNNYANFKTSNIKKHKHRVSLETLCLTYPLPKRSYSIISFSTLTL